MKKGLSSGAYALGVLVIAVLLTLSVAACGGGERLSFSPATLPEAVQCQPYQVTITVSGNKTPVNNIGVVGEAGRGLPPGLVVAYKTGSNTASITGTPQAKGAFKFTLRASCQGTNNPGQTGSSEYELVVK